MAITVNDGGVLKGVGCVSVNDGGVIRSLASVSANDGGVIREVFSANKLVVNGITPFEEGDGYVALTKSGTFTLTAPAGTKITLGGGGYSGGENFDGDGGDGGAVLQHTLTAAVKNAACTLTVGKAEGGKSTLTIDGVEYGCGSTKNSFVQTKFGQIGGKGGDGGWGYWTSATTFNAEPGSGGGKAGNASESGYTQPPYGGEPIFFIPGGGGGGAYGGKGGDAIREENGIREPYGSASGGNGGGKNGTAAGSTTNSNHNSPGGISSDGCGNGGLGCYDCEYDSDGEPYWVFCGGGGGGGFSGGGGGAGTLQGSGDASGGEGGQGICVIEF